MKKPLLLTLILVLAGFATPDTLHAQTARVYKARDLTIPSEIDPEKVKDAGNAAMEELLSSMLARTDLPKKFAVLPLERDVDNDYFTMQLRNYFTNLGRQNGYEIYTRSDDQWNQILSEIKWGDQYGDTMDPATVKKFGRIQGVDGLLVGRISSISKNADGQPVVRVTIQAFEVETGKQVWGNEVKGLADKSKESVGDASVISKVPGGWLTIGAAVVGFILLLAILRAVARASRPR